MPWKVPENPPLSLTDNTRWPSIYFQAHNASFKAWILAAFAGDVEPVFPYLATSFAGAMIGITLARPEPVKRLPLIGGLTGLGLMGIGGIFLAFGFYTLSNGRPALGNYLLILGGQIGIFMLMLWLVEYRGKSEKFANNIIVKHFRLWGMISLTIYCLQIFEILPRWILGRIISLFRPINLLESSIFGYGQEYLALLIGLFVVLFFELMVFLWSKIDFKFSFEWFIIRLASLGSKAISKRLDVDLMMNGVNWISYKQIIEESEVA